MNGITEQPAVPVSPKRDPRSILLRIIAALALILLVFAANRTLHIQAPDLLPPHITVSGLIVHQGIAEFQTGNPEPIPSATTLKIFVSLLILYVVAPTVVIFFLLRARQQNAKGSPDNTVGVKNVLFTFAFIASLTLLAIVVIDTAAGAFISPSTFTTMKSQNEAACDRDMLSRDLVLAYVDYMRYYYQNERSADKNRGIVKAGTTPVRLPDELGLRSKSEFGTLYLEPGHADSVVVFSGVGTVRGTSERFRNADGDSGKIQCSIMIRPASHKFEIQQIN